MKGDVKPKIITVVVVGADLCVCPECGDKFCFILYSGQTHRSAPTISTSPVQTKTPRFLRVFFGSDQP